MNVTLRYPRWGRGIPFQNFLFSEKSKCNIGFRIIILRQSLKFISFLRRTHRFRVIPIQSGRVKISLIPVLLKKQYNLREIRIFYSNTTFKFGYSRLSFFEFQVQNF